MTLAGKTIVFRVDASLKMGAGHVMRCVTAADALRIAGADVHFVCREHEGNLIGFLQSREYQVHALSPPANSATLTGYADWLGVTQDEDAAQCSVVMDKLKPYIVVLDLYGLDRVWECKIKQYCQHIVVIDDLANRQHSCSLLLDQNLGKTPADYSGLIPKQCVVCTGPQYALLRPDFGELRSSSLARRSSFSLRNILISMGGIDKDNVTLQILQQLERSAPDQLERVTIVMGRNAPWKGDVFEYAARLPFATQVVVDVTNMATLMMEADLAIGAAGGTAWERCCLGLPSLIVVLADNQIAGSRALCETGAAMLVGTPSDIAEKFGACLHLLTDSARLQAMSVAASQVTDGQGTPRFIQLLETL